MKKKNILEQYVLQAGKLVMKDGTKYNGVLFLETDYDKFVFIDRYFKVRSIDPTQIKSFVYNPRIKKELKIKGK